MHKVLKKAVDLALGLLMLPMVTVMSLHAQQTFNTTIYLDYRYYLTTEGPVTLKPASDTTAYLSNQFVFRRAYFTYENKINDNLKFRFRLDADNTANVTGVSLTGSPVSGVSLSKDDKLRPFIKHLYLQYDNFLVPMMTLNVGMIETLTFKYKEIQLQAQITPIAGINIFGYMDTERKLPVAALPAETKPKGQTYKVDAYFEMVKNLVLGGEWFTYQNDLYQTDGEKYDVGGWSAFGRYVITDGKFQLFARYDSYRPNSLDRDLDMSLVIVGFDWAPYHGSWKLQPNVWFTNYANGVRYNASATKNSDVVFNLTFFLSF
jgi:hypothetical protein